MSRLRRRLLRRLDRIERLRASLLADLAALPAGALAAHPIEGKWSILEIVEHLVLAEAGFIRALDRADPLPRRTPKDVVLHAVVMFVLRYDVPVRVPARSMLPTGGRGLGELSDAWIANHRRLREWLGTRDAASLRRPLVRHPVAGPLSPKQALRMLEVHLRRHMRQIDERRAVVG